MEKLLNGVKKIHFIGIGGSGMFPIVEILSKNGYEISGSDNNESDITRMVLNMGIKVNMQQKAENIKGADLIIYTSAILENNEELVAAKKSGIKMIERNDFLNYFTKKYSNCICVCGTHGKTTTTSMLTQNLLEAGKDPSAIIGGKLNAINGYSRLGKSSTLVCEACEFKDHFLKLNPNTTIVLNIDDDHLDYFKTMERLKSSFKKFCEKTTDTIIYNGDDENTKEVISSLLNKTKKFISYGFNETNDYYATNIKKQTGMNVVFDVYKNKKLLFKEAEISIPGKFNILNALATLAASLENGVEIKDAVASLKNFKGAGKRLELVGKIKGITVLQDYAHHPKEVFETLKAVKESGFKNVWVIHQPYTFSRTVRLKKEFKDALSVADRVVITEILGGREQNTTNFTGKDLANLIDGAVFIKEQEDVRPYILKNAKEGDVVVTMGCGDIYKSAKMIVYGKY